MMNEEIIYDAAGNLKRLANLQDVTFMPAPQGGYDYDLTINGITFACEVKKLVNKANYNLLIQRINALKTQTDKPLLVVAQHFVPEIFDNFPQEGINVLESNGNCHLCAAPLFIRISGQKPVMPKGTKGKAFNEAGLKLIFYFLLDDGNINLPYRKISEETGASLGTIKNVMEELSVGKFLITTAKGRFLAKKKELLDVWQTYYNQTLKPKLLLKEMEFVDSESRMNWEKLTLPEGMCWGGEGGAYLLDGYLTPELFDVYTEIPSAKLMMTKKVIFRENGRIRIYQKFWKGDMTGNVAPKILVYADLMGSGNSRCIEAAQRLVEHEI